MKEERRKKKKRRNKNSPRLWRVKKYGKKTSKAREVNGTNRQTNVDE